MPKNCYKHHEFCKIAERPATPRPPGRAQRSRPPSRRRGPTRRGGPISRSGPATEILVPVGNLSFRLTFVLTEANLTRISSNTGAKSCPGVTPDLFQAGLGKQKFIMEKKKNLCLILIILQNLKIKLYILSWIACQKDCAIRKISKMKMKEAIK